MSSPDERHDRGDKPRRKRIITEARKEQNRVAQQLYRKRQREQVRKRETNRRDLPAKHPQLKPRQLEDTRLSTHAFELEQLESPGADITRNDTLQLDYSELVDPGCMVYGPATTDDCNLDVSLVSGIDSGVSIDVPGFVSPSSDQTTLGDKLYPPNIADLVDTSRVFVTMFNRCQPTGYSDTAPQFELFGNKSSRSSLSLLSSIPGSNCNQEESFFRVLENCENTDEVSTDVSLKQIPGLEELISAVARFLLYGYGDPAFSRNMPTSPLFNPYINHIHTSQTSTIMGYLHNARCIGLELHDLIRTGTSPFYHPNTSPTTDSQALLAVARKPSIPEHLQPTLPQILVPHHPYLDLLPFPAMRERAIMLGAATPRLFDPMEMKKDIFRGGLYCHRQRRGAQPWDMKSWEVAPWFLRKWRLLVG